MAQDMVKSGFLRRVYCNNFQYNANFTRRPRRQYSYEVTETVHQYIKILNVCLSVHNGSGKFGEWDYSIVTFALCTVCA